jgi:putative PIN family toxin of toxin-antitoxin system
VKIFLDTNVWLSALIFSGLCAELLAVVDESSHELLTSELVKTEVLEVLQRKFHDHIEAQEIFTGLWESHARMLPDVAEPTDDADRRLVNAAAIAHADFFVTGDQRVLGWEKQDSMHIVSPRVMYQQLKGLV